MTAAPSPTVQATYSTRKPATSNADETAQIDGAGDDPRRIVLRPGDPGYVRYLEAVPAETEAVPAATEVGS